MYVHVTLTGRRDLAGQLYLQLRSAIVDGRLAGGQPVPPSRELATRLDVSRNTVIAAYERLIAEGYLHTRVGSGTFVRDGVSAGSTPAEPPASRLRPVPVWQDVRVPGDLAGRRPRYDLRPGMPDAALFPFDTWRRLMSAALRHSATPVAMYGDPRGHAGLRAAIAAHLGVARAVQAGPDDLVITNGAQQAIDLVGRAFVGRDACVAVEDPGYPPHRLAYLGLGARVVPVPVDDEGIVVDAIPDDARVVNVTPSHQFPLGLPMSLGRRIELLAWARRRDALIVEDDYDSEFRFTGRPMETLHGLDSAGLVAYVGTFSKTLLPNLRLGFLLVPPPLRHAVAAAKFASDWHTPVAEQAALAQFIGDGLFARHVRRMRTHYQRRHQLLCSILRTEYAGLLELVPSAVGLHVAARCDAATEAEFARAARTAGVGLDQMSAFAAGAQPSHGLVLGYGGCDTAGIRAGLSRLAAEITLR